MKKEDKAGIVESLAERLTNARNFYVTDVSTLTVAQTSNLRRLCFDRGIEMTMVKNTLIRKALEKAQINEPDIAPALKGSSSLMFSDSFTAPAKLIKDFRKKNPRPLLKAAYIEQSLYVGDQELDTLLNLKSREELIGGIVSLLQSPIRNVMSGLQSGGYKIAGLLKTLSEKES